MTDENSTISYGSHVDAWTGYRSYLLALIDREGARALCEVGGGANPMLDAADIGGHGATYVVMDISAEELAKAPGHDIARVDVCDVSEVEQYAARFDLVFSRMTAEHVYDAASFHRNVRMLLRPRGVALHFFPTLWSMPFMVNRVLPESLSRAVMQNVAPRDLHQAGKFRPFYRWCRGPTRRQILRLRSVGYDIIEYRGFFGHDYYRAVGPLNRAETVKAQWLLRHPSPFLTSFAYAVLRRRD